MSRVADMVDRWMQELDYQPCINDTLNDPMNEIIDEPKLYKFMDHKNELSLMHMLAFIKDAKHFRVTDGVYNHLVKQFHGFYLIVSLLTSTTIEIYVKDGSHIKSELDHKSEISYDKYIADFRTIEHEFNEIVRVYGPRVFVKPDGTTPQTADKR